MYMWSVIGGKKGLFEKLDRLIEETVGVTLSGRIISMGITTSQAIEDKDKDKDKIALVVTDNLRDSISPRK